MTNTSWDNAFKISLKERLFSIALILIATIIVFSIVHRKTSASSWFFPTGYTSDNISALLFTSLYSDGTLTPLMSKEVSFLNAPIGANFNDLPGNEGFLFWLIGLFQKLFGLFLGSNLATIALLFANALSLYLCLIYVFRIKNSLATMGALIFGLSHFFLLRGFQHSVLTCAFHLPPLVGIATWLLDKDTIWTRRKFVFSYLFAIASGLFFVYYTFIFCLLFGIAGIVNLLNKRWRIVRLSIELVGLSSICLILFQIPTILYQIKNGKNVAVIFRSLAEVELYSLKISDLLIPYSHIIPKIQDWAHFIYFNRPYLIHSEPGYAYLGLLGGLAFLFTLLFPASALFSERKITEKPLLISFYFILLYSITGGFNFVFSSTTGIYLFRCTNRYSIVLLLIAIIFALKKISSVKKLKWTPLLILIALVDLPARSPWQVDADMKEKVSSDRVFAEQISTIVPPGSNIFQLPVVEYPENPVIYKMTDYEHFRPAIYTHAFNWSYGAVRGRPDIEKQKAINPLDAVDFIRQLKSLNFHAVFINKSAYDDEGKKIVDGLASFIDKDSGLESPYFVLYKLK